MRVGNYNALNIISFFFFTSQNIQIQHLMDRWFAHTDRRIQIILPKVTTRTWRRKYYWAISTTSATTTTTASKRSNLYSSGLRQFNALAKRLARCCAASCSIISSLYTRDELYDTRFGCWSTIRSKSTSEVIFNESHTN